MENRHGLLVDACLTLADGHAERVAALHMIEPSRRPAACRRSRSAPTRRMTRKTLSTSCALREGDAACRAEHQRPKFRDRWAHDPARRLCRQLQRIRKRIEEAFWIKVVAGQEKTKFHMRPRPCRMGFHRGRGLQL